MKNVSLIAFFTLLGLGIFFAIAGTCYSYNLFDFAFQDLDWTKQWLLTTVVDFYGCAICLCVIAILSEPFPHGLLWSLGFCLLGSPICCIYCVYRLIYKSLVLKSDDSCTPVHSEGLAMLRYT